MTPGMITGTGVCTPLGLTAAASEAAFRAGLMPASETAVRGGDGEPIRAVSLDLLASGQSRSERMRSLAERALDDLAQSPHFTPPRAVAAFLGLPDLDRDLVAGLIHSLETSIGARVPITSRPEFFCQGRSSLFFALQSALSALDGGTCDGALVGAVDSLCAPEVLRGLYRERRLLGSAADGIIPGEGAGFIFLQRSAPSDAASKVICVSTASEPRHFLQERPSSGQGLSKVLRGLGSQATVPKRPDLMYTCETGEHFWSEELSLAYLRNISMMPEPFVRTMAAQSFGDLGAAAGGVMVAIGVHALARIAERSVPNPLLLVCGSSDDGYVGGCLIQGPADGGNVN